MASESDHATPEFEQNEKESTASVSGAPPSSKEDETLVDELRPCKNMVFIDDWSQTGRGSHVEFTDEEEVPLQQGTFLGRGAAGDVHEVCVQKHKLAHKRMVVKRKIGGKEMKEIEILKRLSSHEHMIQLVGTYNHRQFLGLLVYPVAICDMATFFEDVEAWHNTASVANTVDDRQSLLETNQNNRLVALGYDFPSVDKSYKASLIYSKIGCLISATAYLHDQKIRHKDLKPSNVLLAKDQMWLSDFGSATDFSLLSQSATDNERGTPRYFSPEVAAWQPNGRASDIFSLGCVLLEILILHEQGTLQFMRENRSADPSFHANIKNVAKWLDGPGSQRWSFRRIGVVDQIRAMLYHNPTKRPTARKLMVRFTGYDLSHTIDSKYSIFGECCRSSFVSSREHNNEISTYRSRILDLQSELANRTEETNQIKRDYEKLFAQAFIDNQKTIKIREAQHQTELSYTRDREEWEQEKRDLKNRVAELEGERKKAQTQAFDRLEALLISQQEARIAKDKAKAQAAEDVRKRAAEARKKSDDDRIAQLEKLLINQKDEQLKRETALQAQKEEADEQAAKLAAEKKAAAKADGWGSDPPIYVPTTKRIKSEANDNTVVAAESDSEPIDEK
ncbi:kinase-like domain-containing protein [Phaeosphaeria sp. MPI-PUGE-AT-0046c]|nr:kinase-like domain-containing protein [Phaeosphaeria sp. MPI-PUGE-AT-0046c]